jgi:carbamate kinase
MMMKETIVVVVNGEVLADAHGTSIPDQRDSSQMFAEGLAPILTCNMNIAILHGNKPQVGFVLFRSEIASHVLHSVPLDVCGADTQGATGYLLSQAIRNELQRKHVQRSVMCTLTQTLVDTSRPEKEQQLSAIGPWYDRERAEKYRTTRKWKMIEEPGRGYRRGVPALPPLDVIELDSIKQLVDSGTIVISGGGGGIPVTADANGNLSGIEAVVGTEQISNMFAQRLNAKIMIMVVETATKYIMAHLSIEKRSRLMLQELDKFLKDESIKSRTVQAQLLAASEFLHDGGEQVIITTLEKLPATLKNKGGLWIGDNEMSLNLEKTH